MSIKLRPEQLEVTTGISNNTTVPTLGKVEDMSANGVFDLTSAEVTQLANIDTSTISTTQWGYLGATDQGVATTDSVSFAQVTVDNVQIDGNTISTIAGDLNLDPIGNDIICPVNTFSITSNAGVSPTFELENTNPNPLSFAFEFYKNSASPAAGDALGLKKYYGNNSVGGKTLYMEEEYMIEDPTNGAEDASYICELMHSGTLEAYFKMKTNSIAEGEGLISFNEDKNDVDFVVRGDTADYLLYTDAGNDRVGINTNTPSVTFEINGSAKISTGTFALNVGTTVNEISTTVDGSSTNDELATAKACYDAILAGDKVSVPSGPTDTGTTGQWAYGSGYEYRCVATNTWVRKVVTTTW